MSDSITMLHNPRCSKSRQTRQLIEDKGLSPTVVEYLKTPPDAAELDRLLQMLQLEPQQLMRTGEKVYKELGLADAGLDRAGLIQAMVDNPILIERPIVIMGDRAIIGRPPEKVLELIA